MTQQTELLVKIRQCLQQGDYPQAIAALEEITQLAAADDDYSAAARHMGNLALTQYRLGNHQQALTNFQQALDYAQQGDDRLTQNGLLGNIGNVLREVGRYDDADKRLNEALVMAQELGDTRGRGIWLSNLGLLHDDLQQYSTAADYHERSVEIARQLNDKVSLASRLTNWGNSLVEANQLDAAATAYDETLALYQQLGRADEVALHTGLIGNLYGALGRQASDADAAHTYFSKALDYYGSAAEKMRRVGDRTGEAEVIRSIGNILADAGQYDDAAQYLQVAQQMFEALGLEQQADHSRTTLKRLITFLENDDG